MMQAFAWFFFALVVVFLPGLIAIDRLHRNAAAIVALNTCAGAAALLFLPAGVMLWIAAFVWSWTDNCKNPA